MSKISEKELSAAWEGSEYFNHRKGICNTCDEISAEERFRIIIEILEMKSPSQELKMFYDAGLMEYCIPLCFPVRKSSQKMDLKTIIERFDQCGGELPVRIAVLLFPFEIDMAHATLKEAAFDPEASKMMISALKDMEDFILIKEKEKLKKFIFEKGWDYYYFLDSLAEQLTLALDFPEYKRLSKKYLVEEIKRHREPIFPEDLAIQPSDLIESGITKEAETEEMMNMLAECCHLKPYDNKKDVLLKRAAELKRSRLKRAFRNIRWIR